MNLASQAKRLPTPGSTKRVMIPVLLGLILSAVPGTVSAQTTTSPANPFRNQSFNTVDDSDKTNDEKIFDFFPELYNKSQKTPVI